MKKIIFALLVLMFVAPAWATVVITCVPGAEPNEVIIGYDATVPVDEILPRAFGLDIRCNNDANIVEVTGLSTDYIIYPGSININAMGQVVDYGSIAASPSYPGTLPGVDTNGVSIECGSLYAPTGPGSPNAPPKSGVLLSLKVDGSTCLIISGNVVRAGSKGVVMEDPDVDPTVTFPGAEECCVSLDAYCTMATECAGHASGDATCDGNVNLGDLIALKAAWGQTGPPWVAPHCCADFDNTGAVNLGDLIALKGGWGQVGLTPSTANQACPP